MNYKKLISFSSILIIFSIVYAQTYQIDLTHVGYGKTGRYAVFVIRNIGDVEITDITIFIDGEEYTTMYGVIGSGAGFEKTLYLEPAEHLIEVRSAEGAFDSESINILEIEEKPTTIKGEEKISLIKENELYIGTGILILIIVIGIWLLTRKPKPELKSQQS